MSSFSQAQKLSPFIQPVLGTYNNVVVITSYQYMQNLADK